MNRIDQTLSTCQSANKTVLVPYISAGDPNLEVSLNIMHALVEAGADIIELGMPFSDPSADGPTIQLANERAIAGGTGVRGTLELVKQFRQTNQITPIVLMGYLNPIEFMGTEVFAQNAAEAGADGVLIVDMPAEEAQMANVAFTKAGLQQIFLIAPTTGQSRLEEVAKYCAGYAYYVSFKGVTGARSLDVNEVKTRLDEIKKIINLPIGVGFGIRDGQTARAIGEHADAVIIGSALVQQIEENLDKPDTIAGHVQTWLAAIRADLDK